MFEPVAEKLNFTDRFLQIVRGGPCKFFQVLIRALQFADRFLKFELGQLQGSKIGEGNEHLVS